MGEEFYLVNPTYDTAKGIKELLAEQGIPNKIKHELEYEYYVSDGVD